MFSVFQLNKTDLTTKDERDYIIEYQEHEAHCQLFKERRKEFEGEEIRSDSNRALLEEFLG